MTNRNNRRQEKHRMDQEMIRHFEGELRRNERSEATIEKYVRDVRHFLTYLREDKEVTKDRVIAYKQDLARGYAPASANSMLVALNQFFKYAGWYECIVKAFKTQEEPFRRREQELTREEYFRLLKAAMRKGNRRLYLLMETICATGIRVSELPFITVEAAHTKRARVSLKGKSRAVILPGDLCRKLLNYVKEKGIRSGSIFITRSGRPMDRNNILNDMKKLSKEAGVSKSKIYPHNLRHLFAVQYYEKEKDLSHLADILGHSKIETTRIYTKISCEEQEVRIGRLGLIYSERSQKNIA